MAAGREDCTVDLDEYASAVTAYISTCIETVATTKHYRKYTNQKPWINCDVRAKLRARSSAFVMGTAEDYKKARYEPLERPKDSADRRWRATIPPQTLDACAVCCALWCSAHHRVSAEEQCSHIQPDELNEFYARFEAQHPDQQSGMLGMRSTQYSPLMVPSADVRKVLSKTNPRKAAGPDNIPGCALRVCSSERAESTTIVPIAKKSNVTCLND